MDDSSKPDHIDELKRRLDSASGSKTIHKRQGVLHETYTKVSSDWDIKTNVAHQATKLVEQTLYHNSMFKKIFIGSIIFFICAVAVALLIFLSGNNTVSNRYIDISVIGSSYTAGGEDLPLQILVTNNNPVSIELADLFIEYPKGTRGDTGGDIVRLLKPVGSIASGGTMTIPVTPVLYGEQGSLVEIDMRLEYRINDSNAIFTKEKKYGVTINTSPLSISVSAPQTVVSNQEVEFKVNVVSNTSRVSENMRLQIEYPPGFQFIESTPEPMYGNAIWNLGDLSQGAEREIIVRGVLLGTDGDERTFRVFGGSEDSKDRTKVGVVYNSFAHVMAIDKAFIDARIVVAGQDEDVFVTDGNTPLNVEIKYENSLAVRVTDLELVVSLAGSAFNSNNINIQNGYYDNSLQTITFNKNTNTQFSNIPPGGTGYITFTVTPKSLIQQAGSFIRDPYIDMAVSVRGRQPSEGNNIQEALEIDRTRVKVSTDFQLLPRSVYSVGPFINSGPVPPSAGQDTTYTIIWTIKNTANPVSGATATADLPIWVDFTGSKHPSSEQLQYDESSRKLTWNIGTVSRAVGFSSNETREVSFQVKLKASNSQIGKIADLVTSPKIVGTDSWTGELVQRTIQNITTKITTDPTYSANSNHSVVE